MHVGKFLHLAAGAVALPAISRTAWAQAYPTRPITMIVPFAAGGTTDAMARVIAKRMGLSLGQPVVVENVGGVEGTIAAGRTARARPDGYTIDLGTISNHALNSALYLLPYDVLNDFVTISPLTANTGALFARKTVPAKDLNELIVWLKATPCVSVGIVVSGFRLLALSLQQEIATQLTLVPYPGVAPARQALMAGHIDLLFDVLDALQLVQAGSIKIYAVTSDTRSALAPDIPTFGEVGLPGVSISPWYGLFAPRGTPKDIVAQLNAAVVEALADPDVRARLTELKLEVFARQQQTPEGLSRLVNASGEKWLPIIKEFGIRAE